MSSNGRHGNDLMQENQALRDEVEQLREALTLAYAVLSEVVEQGTDST